LLNSKLNFLNYVLLEGLILDETLDADLHLKLEPGVHPHELTVRLLENFISAVAEESHQWLIVADLEVESRGVSFADQGNALPRLEFEAGAYTLIVDLFVQPRSF